MPESMQAPGQPAGFKKGGFRLLLLGLLGLFLGAGLGEDLWGALSGTAIGLLIAQWSTTQTRLRNLLASLSALEEQHADLARRIQRAPSERPRSEGTTTEATPVEPHPPLADEPVVPAEGQEAASEAARSAMRNSGATTPPPSRSAPPSDTLEDAVTSAFARRAEATSPSEPEPPQAQTPTGPPLSERVEQAIRSFFFGGNTVVRVGLLVLLVGLTLLAKYAADNALLPVEARLAAAALIGLGLTAFGFRQRTLRPGFGLSLQGGGIAALYLVVFFAFRVYELVPAGLAFAFFVGLAISTAILSVLQASEALLIIGSLGGFLAPILASTGEGSHVALFSYYLLLITSIAAVAWSHSWRMPSVVAFVCTYGVATTWGVLRYEETLFASTQPFVLAFMALFTAIAVLQAWRRPPQLRGFVDATLVFGTPLISLGLQASLVREMELGLALSAAGFGLFYAVLATWLWRAAPPEVRPLSEAFVALAVGFGTMAIPFTFDEAMTTSIAWALEGAGLYWIGARQSRLFPRLSGMLLQVLAAGAFVASSVFDQIDSSTFLPIANGRALSCLALAVAGIFIAQQAYAKRERMSSIEMQLGQALGAWGLLWWTGGFIQEIDQFVPEPFHPAAALAMIAATTLALELGGARRDWEPGRWMALVGLPAATWLLLAALEHQRHVLADGGWLAWPAMFAALYFVWARRVDEHPRRMAAFRAGGLWLLALAAALAGAGIADHVFTLPIDWQLAAFGSGLAVVLGGSLALQSRGRAPFDREPRELLTVGLGPIAGVGLLWILLMQLRARGYAAPIPHLPLLNPVDITAAMLGLSALFWWERLGTTLGDTIRPELRRGWYVGLVALAFIWLNGILVRAVHQWTGVHFDPESLWNSVALQVCFSIIWTLVALAGMLLSSRRSWRQPWMVCAGLLGVVVVKLFTVDLSQLSTVARIGTFLAVGALLLVLGYLSPVPPNESAADSIEPIPEPEGELS